MIIRTFIVIFAIAAGLVFALFLGLWLGFINIAC